MSGAAPAAVGIRPYAAGDLPLLERLLGDPAMTAHLGGPETPEALRARHARYLASDPAAGGLFVIVLGSATAAGIAAGPDADAAAGIPAAVTPAGMPAGWVGFWESSYQGEPQWECGWNVLPEHQGRGVATAGATLMLEHARRRGKHRFMLAFPAVGNAASNAVCRRLGFISHGEVEVEYPAGMVMLSNEWTLDLWVDAPQSSPLTP